jgi:hypothetical protein
MMFPGGFIPPFSVVFLISERSYPITARRSWKIRRFML